MPTLHQVVAGFSNGDAISNEARYLRDLFLSWGHGAAIYSEAKRILPALRREARDIHEAAEAIAPEDVVLLHLSIGSPVNDAFTRLPGRKVILYHNVTPAHYYDLVHKQTAFNLEEGRHQVAALAGAAEINLACSHFNAKELEALGYADVKVLPLVLDYSKLETPPDRKTLRRFDDGLTNILFVGRCAPNKKLEDALQAFAFYHRFVNSRSRFIHVGSFAGTERYYYLLQTQARELGLEQLHFAGAVPQAQLNAFYKCSQVFLCMSEHEGFGIPLIESMFHQVPVLAYDAAAVAETLDGAGVLFHEKRYDWVAEMIDELARPGDLRDAVIRDQNARLARFRNQDLPGMLKTYLAPLLP